MAPKLRSGEPLAKSYGAAKTLGEAGSGLGESAFGSGLVWGERFGESFGESFVWFGVTLGNLGGLFWVVWPWFGGVRLGGLGESFGGGLFGESFVLGVWGGCFGVVCRVCLGLGGLGGLFGESFGVWVVWVFWAFWGIVWGLGFGGKEL